MKLNRAISLMLVRLRRRHRDRSIVGGKRLVVVRLGSSGAIRYLRELQSTLQLRACRSTSSPLLSSSKHAWKDGMAAKLSRTISLMLVRLRWVVVGDLL